MDTMTYAAAVAAAKKLIKEGGGSGTGLPTVTTEDNGKMLQVVDGAWSAVTITDGNEVAY